MWGLKKILSLSLIPDSKEQTRFSIINHKNDYKIGDDHREHQLKHFSSRHLSGTTIEVKQQLAALVHGWATSVDEYIDLAGAFLGRVSALGQKPLHRSMTILWRMCQMCHCI